MIRIQVYDIEALPSSAYFGCSRFDGNDFFESAVGMRVACEIVIGDVADAHDDAEMTDWISAFLSDGDDG